MNIETAQSFLGQKCIINFRDSYGDDVTLDLRVKDVISAPLYGSFLIGDVYDVNLDMVMSIYPS